MGPLIQPCACRGDISIVHHGCLKKWLVEQVFFQDVSLRVILSQINDFFTTYLCDYCI